MKYFLTFIITNIVVGLIWVALFCLQLGQPTQAGKWNYDAYNYKEALANKINTNKIVVVAGSNALFGFDSKMLSEASGMPVVNGAVNAGLGLDYILYRSKSFLKNGDIAILPLEYSFYQNEAFGGTVLADYIVAWDLDYYKQLSLIHKIKVLFLIDDKRLYKGLKRLFVEENFSVDPMYNLSRLNEHGDHKNMSSSDLPSSFYEKKRNELVPDNRTNSKLSKNFVLVMENYMNWANKNNITLIFAPQAQMYFDEYNGKRYKKFHENIFNFYKNRNVRFVGNPYNYMFPKKKILDTRAHLNLKGGEERTKQLIDDIDFPSLLNSNYIKNEV